MQYIYLHETLTYMNVYICKVSRLYRQARNQGAKPLLENFSPPLKKLGSTSFKTIEHSSNNLGPSQKTLRPS